MLEMRQKYNGCTLATLCKLCYYSGIRRQTGSVSVYKGVVAVTPFDCVNARHLCRHCKGNTTLHVLGSLKSQNWHHLTLATLKPSAKKKIISTTIYLYIFFQAVYFYLTMMFVNFEDFFFAIFIVNNLFVSDKAQWLLNKNSSIMTKTTTRCIDIFVNK